MRKLQRSKTSESQENEGSPRGATALSVRLFLASAAQRLLSSALPGARDQEGKTCPACVGLVFRDLERESVAICEIASGVRRRRQLVNIEGPAAE